MAYPNYDEFVLRESQDVVEAFRRRHRRLPSAPDLYHNAWRRFDERWTHRDILHDILGEPLEDGGAGGDNKPPVPDPGQPPTGETPGEIEGRIIPYGARSVQDALGPQLQLTLSDFSLLRLYREDKPATLGRIEQHANKGFSAMRVLGSLVVSGNGGSWVGREILPSWPDHLDLVASLTKEAYTRGMRIIWTLLGGAKGPFADAQARASFAVGMAHALSTAPEGVLFVEMCNEPFDWDIGPLSLAQCAEMEAAFTGAASFEFLTALGASDIERFKPFKAERRVLIQHLDRNTSKSEKQDRPWRQGWDAALAGMRWCDNEPIGHGSSVNSEQRPSVLRSHRLVNYICRAFSSCLHATQPGVYAMQPWEEIPAYHQVWKSRIFLPPHLADGRCHNSNDHFPGRPFEVKGEDYRAGNGNSRGLVRLYTNELDGVFYAVPFGLISDIEIQAKFNMQVRAFSQDAEDLLWERQIGANDWVPLAQATDYLLVCERM